MDEKIVYIILGIIGLIFSFVKKQKKANKENLPKKKNDTFFSQIEKMLLGEEFTNEPKYIQTDSELLPEKPIEKPIEIKQEINTNILNNNIIPKKESPNNNKYFNIKKAIIYSTILNRPNY